MNRFSRRHGFTLVETLLAVSLLGAFSLLAFRLIGAEMHIADTTLNSNINTARFDHAMQMLRADIAISNTTELPEPDVLRIHHSETQFVEWKINRNSLTRSAAADHRSWDVGQPIHLTMDGSIVLLSISPTDQIAMASPPKEATR